MCQLSKNWPKSTWLKPDRLWTKKVKVLEWLSQNTNLCPIKHLWNYLKLKFTNILHSIWCSLSVFLRTLWTAWWKQRGLNAFVVIAQTLLFVSKDLQIIIMQVMVEGKRQEHPEWRNEAVCTGTDAERQEEDVCLHQPNTCFSLGAAVCHCHGFLEVANYLWDGNNLLGFERYLVVVL